MKKTIKMEKGLLCLLLLYLAAFLPVCSQADPDRTEVREKICQYCEAEFGYTKDEIAFNNLVKNKNDSWDFSLCVKKPEEMTNGLIVGLLNKDGTLASITGPAPVSIFQWLNQELSRCLFHYQDLFQLKQRWAPRLDSIPEEDMEVFNRVRKVNPILDVLQLNIVLPDEKCISYEEALKKCVENIEQIDGWTPEMTSHIGIIAELVYIPDGMDHPVYRFVYSFASDADYNRIVVMNEEYTRAMEKEHKRMEEEEEAIFGDVYPMYISVRIDACTGELAELIYKEMRAPLTDIGVIAWK